MESINLIKELESGLKSTKLFENVFVEYVEEHMDFTRLTSKFDVKITAILKKTHENVNIEIKF